MAKKINKHQIPSKVIKLIHCLKKAGYSAFIVGGCVRDLLMNKQPNDWDVTTSAKPEQVQDIFVHTIETGKAFGTITVVIEGEFFEVTTFRGETDYEDHRHPKTVWFSNSINDDLQRRDFTINAIACDIEGHIIDLYGGQNDIDKGILRCVGKPQERFNEDPLRILRAIRFAVKCKFDIESRTEKAIIEQAPLLKYVSMERCRDELLKMFEIDGPNAIEMLYHYKLFSYLFPKVKQFKEDACLEAMQHAKTMHENFVILLRELIFENEVDKATLYKEQLRFLKVSEANVALISTAALLEYDKKYLDEIQARRALRNYGEDAFKLAAKVWRLENTKYDILPVIQRVIQRGDCITVKQLAITGNDLIKIGYEANKQLGEVLQKLLDIVIEEPKKNKKEHLLMIAKTMK